MEEIFKKIKGYSFYKISNFGRVKSTYFKKDKFCAVLPNHKNKYMMVWLCENQIRKAYLVHRLVGQAFIPNPQNKPQINHKNGIKSDNSVENLEWCFQSHNMKHAYKTGLAKVKIGKNSQFAVRVGKYLDGVLLKEYMAVTEALDDGFSRDGIFQSITTGCLHYGFNWKYLDKKKSKPRKNPKPICSFINNKVVKIYNSHSEMVDDGLWVGNVYVCLKHPERTYKKLYWKYA